jgi:hypothetical protein
MTPFSTVVTFDDWLGIHDFLIRRYHACRYARPDTSTSGSLDVNLDIFSEAHTILCLYQNDNRGEYQRFLLLVDETTHPEN